MKWCLFYLILNGFKKEKNKIKCIFAYMWFYGFLYKGKEYLGDICLMVLRVVGKRCVYVCGY